MPAERASPAAEVVLETIRSRRVTRTFEDRPVADELLIQVLEAGRWATSGGNRRIHRFLVVRDPGMLARLRAVTPGMFSTPAAVIVICTDTDRAAEQLVQLKHDATTLIDVGTAAMNMMIAAHALGLGTCPVTSFSQVAAAVVLQLPSTAVPELLLLVGYPVAVARSGQTGTAGPMKSAPLPAGLVSWERLEGDPLDRLSRPDGAGAPAAAIPPYDRRGDPPARVHPGHTPREDESHDLGERA